MQILSYEVSTIRGQSQYGVTVSVGTATTGEGMLNAFSLLAASDAAPYEAKRHGRDRSWPVSAAGLESLG